MNIPVKYILLIAFMLSAVSAFSQKQIYAVIVGVSDYKYDELEMDLNYCDDDARSFYNLLTSSGVDADNIALLIDQYASKQNITQKLDFIFSKADADDEVIFFFSGHGDDGCFLPYDFSGNYNTVLDHSVIKNAFKDCDANKKLCLADACFSGSIKRPSDKSKEPEESESLEKNASNIAVMMSSRDYQTSREIPSLRSGVFTYYLVKGLKGPADKNRDKTITVKEMYYYTKQNVMEETGEAQIPIIFGDFSENMPILHLR